MFRKVYFAEHEPNSHHQLRRDLRSVVGCSPGMAPVARHFLHIEAVFPEAPNVLAHVGAGCGARRWFGSGAFYLYACIGRGELACALKGSDPIRTATFTPFHDLRQKVATHEREWLAVV